MLIVLGIAVLAVSFVVALFSLVAEERKRERLNAQANALPDNDNQVSGGGSSQAVWGLKTPADNPTEPKTAASRAATDEDVFPWEQ
ncbi:hypothetical protein HYZ70_00425, partial [Candidatus Curtissbacteria bacterium]|nr:hypothetical protein [Candidatus Curtissbacteria bacterium]